MAKQETPGGRLVRLWVEGDPGRSYMDLARTLGVSYQSLYSWRVGGDSPQPHHRAALQVVTGIEPDVWQTTAERKRDRDHAERMRALRAKARLMVARGTAPSTR